MGFEVERKYVFKEAVVAEELVKYPHWQWQQIGILQWYLESENFLETSTRVRLHLEKTAVGVSQRWIFGRKRPNKGNLEQRHEEEIDFSPEEAARTLCFLDVHTLKKIQTLDFHTFAVIAKLRYILKTVLPLSHPVEIVLDFFTNTPDYFFSDSRLLEIEIKDLRSFHYSGEIFDQALAILGIQSQVVDVTQNRAFTNHSIAIESFQKNTKRFDSIKGISEMQRILELYPQG